jgi:hypothetical protein
VFEFTIAGTSRGVLIEIIIIFFPSNLGEA